jgi:ubiquinone/menaquinone biosynthesis C-methylase UbiE
MVKAAYFDEKVASEYERWYETGFGRRADLSEKKLIEEFLRFLPRRRLLEIGCGTGHFTRWLRELGFEAVGVDFSTPMLEVATSLSPEVTYLRADAHRLPFKEDSFDLTVAITALEFVADPMTVIAEMMRVSSEAILLAVLNRWSFRSLSTRVKAYLKRKSSYRGIMFFSAGQLKRTITEAARERGISVEVSYGLTLYPKLLPVLSPHQPFGAFIVVLAKVNKESSR